jgi:D-alanyl-D-alanine carboxypeptidase (penicillin-binding protein 5/6)
MRVVDTRQIYARRRKVVRHKKRVRRSFVVLALIVLVVGYSYLAYQRPLPDSVAIAKDTFSSKAAKPALSWPSNGQSAIGSTDFGLMASAGAQTPTPTASVAKVLTALAVLKQKPIALGQPGGTLTMTDVDVAAYNYYAANDGSVVKVQADEQMSEYQALEAMLLPSANNIADSLAYWAFGTIDNFNTYANNLALQLGMTNTHITDPSGYAPETVSTANDLVRLGLAAMQDPVLAGIVAQTRAVIPVAGEIRNVNWQLGKNGIIGIKTGNTEQAGGCYLFAATHAFNAGQKITLVGAIMGSASLEQAMNDATPLLASTEASFSNITVVHKGQKIGTYHTAWNTNGTVIASQNLTAWSWAGQPLTARFALGPVPSNGQQTQQIGTMTVKVLGTQSDTPLTLAEAVKPPSWHWRLFDRW